MTIHFSLRPSNYKYYKLAQVEMNKAKRRGVLSKLDGSINCVDCNAEATEYDHRDYRKPLDVEPVCRTCNRRRGHAVDLKAWLSEVRRQSREKS